MALKAMMNSMNTTATNKCIHLRSFTSSFLPRISTQRLVVIAVSAESALEKLAATIPMVKSTTTKVPIAPDAAKIGMYLFHDGVVREDAKAKVRASATDTQPVTGMQFSFDAAKLEAVIQEAYTLPGIYYVRAWLNEGVLEVGDDIMRVLIGGDIRPHAIDALQHTVGRIKNECVIETELY